MNEPELGSKPDNHGVMSHVSIFCATAVTVVGWLDGNQVFNYLIKKVRSFFIRICKILCIWFTSIITIQNTVRIWYFCVFYFAVLGVCVYQTKMCGCADFPSSCCSSFCRHTCHQSPLNQLLFIRQILTVLQCQIILSLYGSADKTFSYSWFPM